MYGKQMEMFEDGGLNQEGGMIDPVSGNDVPVGSTRSEVRDDIPAMLSEGEFVFPADVVRYFGLERLMEMRQQAKMGLKKMEAMGQMGNSEEATMPDDLPFSIDELMVEEEEEENEEDEGYASGGLIKAQEGTFIPTMQSSPSFFEANPVNISPAQNIPAVTMPQAPATVAQTPVTTGVQTQMALPQTSSVVQPDFRVPTFQDVYTFKKYINTSTKEIRDFPFYFDQPVTPIPEGFVPYMATAEQQPTDTSTQTTQMLSEGPDDSGPSNMPTPEPIDYSKMTAEEITKAYKDNQTANAIMLGIGVAFPPIGLFGSWATNREKNKIEARMKELGLDIPKGGTLNNIIDGVKNLFTTGTAPATVTATTGAQGARTSVTAPPTPSERRAGTTITGRSTTPIGGGMPAARTGFGTTPVGGGMPAARDKQTEDAFATRAATVQSGKTALASSVAKGQTKDIVNAAMDRAEKDAIQKSVDASVKAGKSNNETINAAAKAGNEAREKAKQTVQKEADRVTKSLENLSKGVKTGFNKGGLAARTK